MHVSRKEAGVETFLDSQVQVRPADSLKADSRERLPRISLSEALSTGAAALVLYTALLLRLPYRAPLLNIALTTLALAAFYSYLTYRLHLRVPMKVLASLLVSVILDMAGNRYGLFSRSIGPLPFDLFTHFTTSALSFVPVIWLMTTLLRRSGHQLPTGPAAFFGVTTTFSLAAYYEITELIDEKWFGGQRIWSTRDTVQDLAFDLLGIVTAASIYLIARKRSDR